MCDADEPQYHITHVVNLREPGREERGISSIDSSRLDFALRRLCPKMSSL